MRFATKVMWTHGASPGRVCRAALSPHSGEPDRQRSLLADLAEDVRLAEMPNVMGHLKKYILMSCLFLES